ncbi:MAG: hypothetical protein ABL951_04240 [Alphaproteobacteria bacterium]
MNRYSCQLIHPWAERPDEHAIRKALILDGRYKKAMATAEKMAATDASKTLKPERILKTERRKSRSPIITLRAVAWFLLAAIAATIIYLIVK